MIFNFMNDAENPYVVRHPNHLASFGPVSVEGLKKPTPYLRQLIAPNKELCLSDIDWIVNRFENDYYLRSLFLYEPSQAVIKELERRLELIGGGVEILSNNTNKENVYSDTNAPPSVKKVDTLFEIQVRNLCGL